MTTAVALLSGSIPRLRVLIMIVARRRNGLIQRRRAITATVGLLRRAIIQRPRGSTPRRRGRIQRLRGRTRRHSVQHRRLAGHRRRRLAAGAVLPVVTVTAEVRTRTVGDVERPVYI